MTRTYLGGADTRTAISHGRPQAVIVVGAGMAGIAAANALAHAEIDVVVIEARTRVGGRLHSVDLGGFAVDLGGSWIHEPTGNPLTDLCDDLGIARVPGDFPQTARCWDAATGPVDDDRYRTLHAHAAQEFAEAIPSLLATIGPDATLLDGIRHHAATHAHGDPLLEGQLTAMLRLYSEPDSGAAADRIALRNHPPSTASYGGPYLGDLPVGGYLPAVEALAAGVDVRFESEVSAISIGSAGVAVRTKDGRSFDGTHVVVTVPLGVLQAGSVAFDPPLPNDRRAAIHRLGVGRTEKLICRFDQAWWSEAGIEHLIQISSDGSPELPLVVGFDAIAGQPVLMALAYGSFTESVTDGSVDDAVERLLGPFETILGRELPRPTDAIRSSWTHDPYSRGCYGFVPIGAEKTDLDLLGEPLFDGRVLFAGEATAASRVGFADGAFSSGVREACRLLGRSSVSVGRVLNGQGP